MHTGIAFRNANRFCKLYRGRCTQSPNDQSNIVVNNYRPRNNLNPTTGDVSYMHMGSIRYFCGKEALVIGTARGVLWCCSRKKMKLSNSRLKRFANLSLSLQESTIISINIVNLNTELKPLQIQKSHQNLIPISTKSKDDNTASQITFAYSAEIPVTKRTPVPSLPKN